MSDQTENQEVASEDAESIVVGMEDEEEGAAPGPEQAEAGEPPSEPPIFERRDGSESNGLKRAIYDVPIEVVVSVGTARPLIGELLSMGRNHLLPLDSAINDPVELRVKDRVVARGELTKVPDTEGQLGIKLTEIVNISSLAE